MDITLISGRFASEDAKALLTALTRAKTAYHEEKIRGVHHGEEDIKHSENRIKTLEQGLRDALALIKENGGAVDLHATIAVKPVVT